MRLIALMFAMLCGTAIIAGSGYAYHFWKIEGFCAFLIAGGGLTVIGTALSQIDRSSGGEKETLLEED